MDNRKLSSSGLVLIMLSAFVIAGMAYLILNRNGVFDKNLKSSMGVSSSLEYDYKSEEELVDRIEDYNKASVKVLKKGSSVTEIAEKAGPSVIGIKMSVADDGGIFEAISQFKAEGSGIIIDEEGYVLTN